METKRGQCHERKHPCIMSPISSDCITSQPLSTEIVASRRSHVHVQWRSGRTGVRGESSCSMPSRTRMQHASRLVEEPWSPVISQNLLDDQATIYSSALFGGPISLAPTGDHRRESPPRRRPQQASMVTKRNICQAKISPATREARQDASDGYVSVRA